MDSIEPQVSNSSSCDIVIMPRAPRTHQGIAPPVLHFFICIFRLFLRGLPDIAANFPATIRSKLESTGYLRHFASLKNKDLNWDSCSVKYTLGGHNFPFDVPPPSKKAKDFK